MKSSIIIALCLLLPVTLWAREASDSLQAVNDSAGVLQGYPVTPFGDTLFFIYDGIGPMSAKTRATIVTKRIEILDESKFFELDSIKIENYESNEYIVYGDIPLLTITEADARREGVSQIDLAQKRLQQIRASITKYSEEFSFRMLVRKSLLLGLLLIVIAGLVFAVNRLFKFLYAFIEKRMSAMDRGIKIGSATLSNPHQLTILIVRTAKWLRVFIILLLIYLSLPVVIYLVPASKTLTESLLDYTLTPVKNALRGFVDFIPNLFTILVIIILFGLFTRLIKIVAQQIRDGVFVIPGFYADWAMSTFNILRFFLYAFMLIVIFPYLPGSGSPIFQGVSVFLGLLVSLGSAGSIANIISGIVITYMRAFQLGDRIKVGDVEGDVIEKSMLVTRIKTIKEEEISVPNSTLMSGTVKNYSKLAREKGLIIYTSVTIGYDAPWQQVHQALLIAADRTEAILKDPKPFVLQMALNDFYVEYQINGYIHDAHIMVQIYSQLRQNIQDSFNEAGIEIMSPHYSSLRDGNKTSIPENYLPKDYERPGFRIEHGDKNS